MELSSCQKPAASPGNNQGKRTHLQLQVAVKNRRHQRQRVPADRDSVQSFHRLMGTSCLVELPQHKASLSDKRKVFPQSKGEEETLRGGNTGSRQHWSREEGGAETGFWRVCQHQWKEEEKRCFWPPCLVQSQPLGASEGALTLLPSRSTLGSQECFSTKERPVGADGPQWSRGHWMDPTRALGGCGNQAFLGSKTTRSVQQHHCWSCGRMAACTGPGLPGSAALHALSVRSRGWLSLTSGFDPVEPPGSVFPPRKGLPNFVLAAAMGTVMVWAAPGSHPCLGRSDQATPSPGIRVVHNDGVRPHLLLPGAGIILCSPD